MIEPYIQTYNVTEGVLKLLTINMLKAGWDFRLHLYSNMSACRN